jgi:hypothetical protein
MYSSINSSTTSAVSCRGSFESPNAYMKFATACTNSRRGKSLNQIKLYLLKRRYLIVSIT